MYFAVVEFFTSQTLLFRLALALLWLSSFVEPWESELAFTLFAKSSISFARRNKIKQIKHQRKQKLLGIWAAHCTEMRFASLFSSGFTKVHIFWEGHKIFRNLHLTVCTVDKSKMKISQNFVTFSEYMNFNCWSKWMRNLSM